MAVPLMIKGMDLGVAQGLQSRAVIEAELDCSAKELAFLSEPDSSF